MECGAEDLLIYFRVNAHEFHTESAWLHMKPSLFSALPCNSMLDKHSPPPVWLAAQFKCLHTSHNTITRQHAHTRIGIIKVMTRAHTHTHTSACAHDTCRQTTYSDIIESMSHNVHASHEAAYARAQTQHTHTHTHNAHNKHVTRADIIEHLTCEQGKNCAMSIGCGLSCPQSARVGTHKTNACTMSTTSSRFDPKTQFTAVPFV